MKKIQIISIAFTCVFLYACSNSSETSEENTEKLVENQLISEEVKEDVKAEEQPLSVRDKFTNALSPISLPFSVNTQSIEKLPNTLLISNEVFDLLQLQQIGDFDKNLEQTILGKIDCENNLTGILVSQTTNNESIGYYFLYDEELKVTGLTNVYYSNSEGSNNTTSEISTGQVLTFTTSMDIDGNEIESTSVKLIDMGSFINPGILEGEEEFEGEGEDPIEFAIPTPEELTAGSGVLPLVRQTFFTERLDSYKNAILFTEEENTEMIGGFPAKSYKVVSTQTGKITQVIPISYNADLGEGRVLFENDTEAQQKEFNKNTALAAEKTLETYGFKNVTKYAALHKSSVELKGNEWVFSIQKIGEEASMEIGRIPSTYYKEIEITEVIEPLYDPFAIVSYTIPESAEFAATMYGVFVVGKSQLSILHKKIGYYYLEKINTKGEINQEMATKSINNLNSALSLNGTNAEAAFYLASVYALQENTNDCLQVLNHLKYINNTDSEGYLEMVKQEEAFNKIRNDVLFVDFMKTIN